MRRFGFPQRQRFADRGTQFLINHTDHEKLLGHIPELLSTDDIEKLPGPIVEKLKAESITSMAIAPMVTAGGPLGLMTMGSRRAQDFGQEDLDLLSQISNQIALAVDNAIAYGRVTEARDRLEEERLYLESEIRSEYNFEDIVGKSAALRRVLEQVAIVAPTSSTVLLHGETGTGKELLRRAIHNLSPRSRAHFRATELCRHTVRTVESELFGHEKGAFTGALMQKKGRFELADQGTLFLDEIGDISLELQPKLLRALQEQVRTSQDLPQAQPIDSGDHANYRWNINPKSWTSPKADAICSGACARCCPDHFLFLGPIE